MTGTLRKKAPDILFTVLGLVLGVLVAAPVAFMLSTSFKLERDIWNYDIQWIPSPATTANYEKVFALVPIARFFANSVFVAGAITAIQILTSSLAAYSFARIRFVGRNAMFMAFLATMMIPQYVLTIPLYMIIDRIGLMDTYAALILPFSVSAFSIYLLRNFFSSIPIELDEAARIDGCNRMQTLFKIILPLSKPALSAMVIFVFMQAWNNFFWPLIATSSDKLRVLPLGLAYFQISNKTEWGPLMAIAVLASAPILLVFLFAQRKFIEGMTMSGIKG